MVHEPNENEKHAIECFKRSHKCKYYHLELGHIDVDKAKKIQELVFKVFSEGDGVGVKTTVMCLACNEDFDVTDYDCW